MNQVTGIKNSHFKKVRKSTFERIDTATWMLESEQDLPICKYLHLHASDNDLAKAIDDYLRLAYDSGVVFVSIFTFYVLFVCLIKPFFLTYQYFINSFLTLYSLFSDAIHFVLIITFEMSLIRVRTVGAHLRLYKVCCLKLMTYHVATMLGTSKMRSSIYLAYNRPTCYAG